MNADKVKLRKKEVRFIGHVATGEGLCVDPSKVRAIIEMPPPKDVAAMQRLLGLAQYLVLLCCEEMGIRLNADKVKLRKPLEGSALYWTCGHGRGTVCGSIKGTCNH